MLIPFRKIHLIQDGKHLGRTFSAAGETAKCSPDLMNKGANCLHVRSFP